MSPMPLNGLILIGPGEYTKRGYVFLESDETCLMFVLPGYQWPQGKKPPVPQSARRTRTGLSPLWRRLRPSLTRSRPSSQPGNCRPTRFRLGSSSGRGRRLATADGRTLRGALGTEGDDAVEHISRGSRWFSD